MHRTGPTADITYRGIRTYIAYIHACTDVIMETYRTYIHRLHAALYTHIYRTTSTYYICTHLLMYTYTHIYSNCPVYLYTERRRPNREVFSCARSLCPDFACISPHRALCIFLKNRFEVLAFCLQAPPRIQTGETFIALK